MINLEVEGEDEVIAALDGLVDDLDIEELLDDAAALLLNRIRTRYLSELSTSGAPWVPSFAAKLRAAKGRGGGTLYDSGKLFQSLQLYVTNTNERLIGTDVTYGKYHQFGTRVLPVREFLGISTDDSEMLHRLVVEKIAAALSGP